MDVSAPESSRRRRATVASNLVLEALAAEVVEALRRAGKRSILLRGATTARWLYEDGSRAYSDVDVLVDPAGFEDCERLLETLGFERSAIERAFTEGRPRHASTWTRGPATVDLHRTLVGVGVSAEEAWGVLSENTELLEIGRAEVEALSVAARSLVLALHAAQHGPAFAHTREDLERAIEQVPPSSWAEAARLARLLEAETSMGAGLSSVRSGQRLAESLDLGSDGEVAVDGSPTFHATQGLLWLTQTKGMRAKGRYALSKLFPPATVMRARDASARLGRAGLIRAYGRRLIRFARHAPGVAWALVRLRRDK